MYHNINTKKYKDMKTVQDLYNESSKELRTLSSLAVELFDTEITNCEGFEDYVNAEFCQFFHVESNERVCRIYFKFFCEDRTNAYSLSNGFCVACVKKDGTLCKVDSVKANNILVM